MASPSLQGGGPVKRMKRTPGAEMPVPVPSGSDGTDCFCSYTEGEIFTCPMHLGAMDLGSLPGLEDDGYVGGGVLHSGRSVVPRRVPAPTRPQPPPAPPSVPVVVSRTVPQYAFVPQQAVVTVSAVKEAVEGLVASVEPCMFKVIENRGCHICHLKCEKVRLAQLWWLVDYSLVCWVFVILL